MPRYRILECTAAACRLRFPHTEHDRPPAACPRCGAPLRVAAEGATGSESGGESGGDTQGAPRRVLPLEALLDNVRSAFNVGSILRCADAAGLRRVHLCGVTPTPTHPRVAKQVAKTALGAECSVPWAYAANALDAAAALRAEGATLWALEEGPGALSLFDAPLPARPLALVVGSEVTGVDPGLLALCDRVVCLPMRGVKRSLNVAVAFGVAALLLAERTARVP